ncbi:MAG: DUF4097 family beta strand repeat protein [Oscillospiraceae bacterium]|nr:DUF4097 family beta strand repeat protein [Oscillospiraceae bacterium]
MKILFITASILVILGIILFVAALASNNWDFAKLNSEKFQSNAYSILEDFQGISVNTDTADVRFVLSGDGVCKVECYEQKKMSHRVSAKNGTLEIALEDTRKWYDYITFFSFSSPKITVYLPQTQYAALNIKSDTGDVEIPNPFQFDSMDIDLSTGDVKCYASAAGLIKIKTSTGDILAESISADTLDLAVSTGKVQAKSITCQGNVSIQVSTGNATLTDVQCKNLRSDGSTGDLHLQGVVAAERFSIERSTGDVKLNRCDAAEIEIETDTGSVTGSLLTPKVFLAETDTGRVDVPKSTIGGRCQIETDTGNILITIP